MAMWEALLGAVAALLVAFLPRISGFSRDRRLAASIAADAKLIAELPAGPARTRLEQHVDKAVDLMLLERVEPWHKNKSVRWGRYLRWLGLASFAVTCGLLVSSGVRNGLPALPMAALSFVAVFALALVYIAMDRSLTAAVRKLVEAKYRRGDRYAP